jgi:hypothetical protein
MLAEFGLAENGSAKAVRLAEAEKKINLGFWFRLQYVEMYQMSTYRSVLLASYVLVVLYSTVVLYVDVDLDTLTTTVKYMSSQPLQKEINDCE